MCKGFTTKNSQMRHIGFPTTPRFLRGLGIKSLGWTSIFDVHWRVHRFAPNFKFQPLCENCWKSEERLCWKSEERLHIQKHIDDTSMWTMLGEREPTLLQPCSLFPSLYHHIDKPYGINISLPPYSNMLANTISILNFQRLKFSPLNLSMTLGLSPSKDAILHLNPTSLPTYC